MVVQYKHEKSLNKYLEKEKMKQRFKNLKYYLTPFWIIVIAWMLMTLAFILK